MLPTYPKFTPSYIVDVYETTIRMFNKRSDVDYYEISVWDKDWNPIPFATSTSVIKLAYLGKIEFDIYIKKADVQSVTYICSQSKIKKDDTIRTAINSRICSKVIHKRRD